MREGKRKRIVAPLCGALCAVGLAGSAHAATTYFGNLATGFGGTLGNGSLSFSDSGGNLTATFNPSGSFSGNDVVIYIDSVPGGFNNTSTFADNSFAGPEAVSAENSGNPSRDLITFPTGFGADYALEFENNAFTGLYQLASGGNGSLIFITGSSPPGGGPYSLTFPLSDIGLSQGQSFNFDSDLISTSAYGSNETVGPSVTIPDNSGDAPNAGFNGSTTFIAADTYVTTPVPEPASVAVIAVGGLLLGSRRRRIG
jgi:hypothetical protein